VLDRRSRQKGFSHLVQHHHVVQKRLSDGLVSAIFADGVFGQRAYDGRLLWTSNIDRLMPIAAECLGRPTSHATPKTVAV